MTIEPLLDGIWKRYTTNSSGLINAEKNAYVHAYSHFSYEYSMKNIQKWLCGCFIIFLTANTAYCFGLTRLKNEQ
jgi:hypothetical protein